MQRDKSCLFKALRKLGRLQNLYVIYFFCSCRNIARSLLRKMKKAYLY
jgi:hypothetical protein